MRDVTIFSHNVPFDLFYVIEGMMKNLTCLRGKDYSDRIKPVRKTLNKIQMIFGVGHITFKDLYQMFADSLDNLARSMTTQMKDKVIEDFVNYLITSNIWKNMKIYKQLCEAGNSSQTTESLMSLFEEMIETNDSQKTILKSIFTIVCRDKLFEMVDGKEVIRKAPFPYEACQTIDYMTKERSSLPNKEDFQSLLQQKGEF